MDTSATSLREQRRQQTAARITRCARELTAQHGLDGFTMDDLAVAAEVSRRTLFNYFPGKDVAIRGELPEIPESLLTTFREGGPTGDLIDDLRALTRALLDIHDLDRDDIAVVRRIMRENAKLTLQAKRDFEEKAELFTTLITEREGDRLDPLQARLVPRAFNAVFELSLDTFIEKPDLELADHFDQAIDALRSALA